MECRIDLTNQAHAVRAGGPLRGHLVLRGFATVIPRDETWAATGESGARRFLGEQSYVVVMVELGRSVEFVGVNSELFTERTALVSIRTQHFLSRRMGVQAGTRYSDGGFFRRVRGSGGLIVRW